MKAVFDTKPTSIYDDDLERHYHFPSNYLPVIERSVGDWVVLRRTQRDGGDRKYFGIAHVAAIEPDQAKPGMHFATLTDQWQFLEPVPFSVDGRYWEEELRFRPANRAGVYLQGKSARTISDRDFAEIVAFGLNDVLSPVNARMAVPAVIEAQMDARAAVADAEPRQIERMVTSRVIRDVAFRRLVCNAYEERCAVTRLRIVDDGDNPEVQAAHIWAVGEGGPDVIHNGIALSATVHWMFDRHLITIGHDYRLIVAQAKVPTEFQAVFAQHGVALHLPARISDRPHPSFLEKHRAIFFAKNS